MCAMKDELGKVYGDFKVISYSEEREPSNRCIKWLCECTTCGSRRYINGNNLRFEHIRFCQECKNRDRRKLK